MNKVVMMGDREVGFEANALTPRLYRHKFGRDMIQDMNGLRKSFMKAKAIKEPAEDATDEEIEAYNEAVNDARLSTMDLEIFENVAYLMNMQYEVKREGFEYKSPDEWLESFDIFSIYEVFPHILELWQLNQATTATPKKK